MRTKWKYRAIIVSPVSDKDSINSAVKDSLDPDGGEFTLTVGLSTNGKEPITHYWCNSSLTINGILKLKGLALTFPNSIGYVWGTNELETIFEGIDNVIVGEKTPQEVLDIHGLSTISREI